MAKKQLKRLPAKAAAQQQQRKPNPFELKKQRGHFDTVGKRKTKQKNVLAARAEAVQKVSQVHTWGPLHAVQRSHESYCTVCPCVERGRLAAPARARPARLRCSLP